MEKEYIIPENSKETTLLQEEAVSSFCPETYAMEMRERFHIPEPIQLVNDLTAGKVEGLSQHAVGWYDPATDRICLNLQKMKSLCERERGSLRDLMGSTIFHEAVGHYGLRLLLGRKFDRTMEYIYDFAEPALQEKLDKELMRIQDMRDAKGHLIHRETSASALKVLAVEEYMSQMAEGFHNDAPESHCPLGSLARAMSHAFRRLCFPFHKVSERDISRMLERSYHKVRNRSLPARAMDVLARRYRVPITERMRKPFRKHTYQFKMARLSHMSQERRQFHKILKIGSTIAFPVLMVPILVIKSIFFPSHSLPARPRESKSHPVAHEVLRNLGAQHREPCRQDLNPCQEELSRLGISLTQAQQHLLSKGIPLQAQAQDGTGYVIQRVREQTGEYSLSCRRLMSHLQSTNLFDRQRSL